MTNIICKELEEFFKAEVAAKKIKSLIAKEDQHLFDCPGFKVETTDSGHTLPIKEIVVVVFNLNIRCPKEVDGYPIRLELFNIKRAEATLFQAADMQGYELASVLKESIDNYYKYK